MRIEWTFNNKSVNSVPEIRINTNDRRSSVLTIESVDAKHAGVFNCTATNAAGVASHISELIVRGANKRFQIVFTSFVFNHKNNNIIIIPNEIFYCPSSADNSAVQLW